MLSKPLSRRLWGPGAVLVRHAGAAGMSGPAHNLLHSLPASQTKLSAWNRAVSDAEKLVGYPTSLMSLRTLMSDDLSNMAVHFRKLIGSDHPVLKTAKRLIYHGKNNMQVRGLLVLLLSRAAGFPSGQDSVDIDTNTGVHNHQRLLAEVVEMIYSGHCIHQAVINVPVNYTTEPDEQVRSALQQLEFGNKISILLGDYLLANASTNLASIREPKAVEVVSQAIIDFTRSEFLGKQDPHGRIIPTEDSTVQNDWEERWKLGSGSLLGAGMECAMLVSNQSKDLHKIANDIGVHTALAIQAYDEVKLFTEGLNMGAGLLFSLGSAPVLYHLEEDPQLLSHIHQFKDDLEQVDYKKVFESVTAGKGLDRTRALCETHVNKTMDMLRNFPDNDGRQSFEKLLTALI